MILPVSIVMFVKDINSKGLSLWMQKRVEAGPLNGLMEFPGGKIEHGESSEEAGRREVYEEVGVQVDQYLPIFKRHSYEVNGNTIQLHVHFSNFKDLPKEKGKWFSLEYNTGSKHLTGNIPEVNIEFIDLFLDYMMRQNKVNFVERLWQKS